MSSEYPPPPPPNDPPSPTSHPPEIAAPTRKAKTGCAFWIVAALAVLFFGSTMLLFIALAGAVAGKGGLEVRGGPSDEHGLIEQTIEGAGDKKVLLIPINGLIADLPRLDPFRSEPGLVTTVHNMLRAARRDPAIKAVLLAIDSPGGGITASDVLYHELQGFHDETGKEIVSLLGDVAASGGYYVASASQRIIAHPTTVTGSIGVLMPLIGIEDMLGKIGVKPRPIKSSPMKDTGSIYRDMTPEERAILQSVVNEYYDRFVTVVFNGLKARGVPMPRKELEKHCDGRVFTGEQARQIGLVDEIGYFEDALRATCDRAKLSRSETRVITYRRKPGLMELILARSSAPRAEGLTIRLEGLAATDAPRFLYLWSVGQPGIGRETTGK